MIIKSAVTKSYFVFDEVLFVRSNSSNGKKCREFDRSIRPIDSRSSNVRTVRTRGEIRDVGIFACNPVATMPSGIRSINFFLIKYNRFYVSPRVARSMPAFRNETPA